MVILKETLLTSQERVICGFLDIIIKELSQWTLPAEEQMEFQDILFLHSQPVQGGYEFVRESIIPCYNDLMEVFGSDLGL